VHLGVFVCANRAAVAVGAVGGSAAAGNPVAAGWLSRSCGTRDMRALRLLHRAAQSGKQRHAWAAAPHRDVAYRLCRVYVCRCSPGALVSNGRSLSGLSHSSSSSFPFPLLSLCCLNRYWGIVTVPGFLHERAKGARTHDCEGPEGFLVTHPSPELSGEERGTQHI